MRLLRDAAMTADLHAAALAEIARLEAVEKAGTLGPWQKYNDGVVGFPSGPGNGVLPAAGSDGDYPQVRHDAALIAEARNALPDLLALARGVLELADDWADEGDRFGAAALLNDVAHELRAVVCDALGIGEGSDV